MNAHHHTTDQPLPDALQAQVTDDTPFLGVLTGGEDYGFPSTGVLGTDAPYTPPWWMSGVYWMYPTFQRVGEPLWWWDWGWDWSLPWSWCRHVPLAVLAAVLGLALPAPQVAGAVPEAVTRAEVQVAETRATAHMATPAPSRPVPVAHPVSVKLSPDYAPMRRDVRGGAGADTGSRSAAKRRPNDAAPAQPLNGQAAVLAGGLKTKPAQNPATVRRVTSIEEKSQWMRERQAVPSRPEPAPCTATERHYSVAEVAVLWNTSKDSIRRIFQSEPGVMTFGDTGSPHKRRYLTMRIPHSVLVRVHRRLTNA